MLSASQDNCKLEIPALGRNVSLGYLYNERTDQFRTFSIFKRNVPSAVVDLMPKPSSTIDYEMTNTYAEKFRLFKIDGSIAANILSGLLTVEGSANYLNDENQSVLDVTGILKYEEHTFVEYLKTHMDECLGFYNTDLPNYEDVTHIVSGIEWGGIVAVQFTDKVDKLADKQEVAGRLKIEFEKLKGIMSVSDAAGVDVQSNDKAKKSNFKLSVRGDVSLPSQVPSNYQKVQELIQAVPQLIKSTNEGKGVPLKFFLLPISALKKHLKLQSRESDFAKTIQEGMLTAFVNIFDEISATQQKLNDLFSKLYNNEACVLESERIKIAYLKDNFKISKINFSTKMRETLVRVRSGEPESLLRDICNEYMEEDFSYPKVRSEMYKFKGALKKVEIYHTMRQEYHEIQYFGLTGDLESALLKSIKDCVYILYMNSKFNNNNSDVWNKTRKIFFETLNRPFNRLFLVDCDFPYTSSVSSAMDRSVVQQVIKGIPTVNDVLAEMELATKSAPLTLKAVGRQAKLGELYDARTDTFLDYSLLKENYSKSIVYSTEHNTAESYDIPTERFQDKCDALGINSEQQFSILSNLTPLTRSGKYLTLDKKPFVSLYKKSPVMSFVHMLHLNEKSVKISDPNLLENVAFEAMNKGATHFVTKIEYGFNSIFSVEDLELRTNNDSELVTAMASHVGNDSVLKNHLQVYTARLKTVIDRYDSGASGNEKSKFEQINGSFMTTVYSDIQGQTSNSYVLRNTEELWHFLTTKFIPRLTDSKSDCMPIAYVLYPLSNLAQEVGMLSSYVPYGTLATEGFCPSVLSDVFDSINIGKVQISQFIAYCQANRSLLTDKDLEILKQVKEEFEFSLEKYGHEFQKLVRDIKFGDAKSIVLYSELLTNYQSSTFFDGNKRYAGLARLRSIEEKIQFSKQLHGENVILLGRDGGELELTRIFTEHFDTRIYFLHYHPEWTFEFKEDWVKTLNFFLGSLNNGANDGLKRKFYVINVEFGHSISKNVTGPVIHEYRKGTLSCDNVVSTKINEEVTTQTRIEKLEEEVRTTMMEEIKAQIANLESTMGSDINEVIKNNRIRTKELAGGINELGQKIGAIDRTISILKDSVGLQLNDITKNTETQMEELKAVVINELGQNIQVAISNLKGKFISKISSEIQSTSFQTTRKIFSLESELEDKISRGLQSTSLQMSRLKCAGKKGDPLNEVFCPGATKYASFVELNYSGETPDLCHVAMLLNRTELKTEGVFTTGCSGTIKLPSKGEFIVLDFNLARTNGASQRYLWTLDATQIHELVAFKVKLTLLCQHPTQILDDNTLTFTEWYKYKDTTTKRISSSSQNSGLLSNKWDKKAFISFNAKTIDSGAGFILRVDVLDTNVLSSASSSSATHTESVGSASYSLPSSSHDFSSIAINPTPAAKMTLTVDVDSGGDSNEQWDSVDILEFGMDGVPKQLGMLSGRQSGISYETENPVAALFYWLPGRSGRGVQLSWK